MFKIHRFIILAVCLIILSFLAYGNDAVKSSFYSKKCIKMTDAMQYKYDNFIDDVTDYPLWIERDAYDATHNLMVPMHYAFATRDLSVIKRFEILFAHFMEDYVQNPETFEKMPFLYKLQWLYLATQYVALAVTNGYAEQVPNGLLMLSEQTAEDYLQAFDYKGWGIQLTSIQRLQYIISGGGNKHYYGAVTDRDFFSLAILSDCRYVHKMQGQKITKAENEAVDLAWKLVSAQNLNKDENGGWLFQVGVWSNHPSYLWSGNKNIEDNLSAMPRMDVAWDTSHFHRMPLWLRSFEDAADSDKRHIFVLRRKQLANQLCDKVLKYVDGKWVLSTFMDGTNGVYRYDPRTGKGIAGYELSGTAIFGWWAFLGDAKVEAFYKDVCDLMPLEDNERNPYRDTFTTRKQNPYFDSHLSWDNGVRQVQAGCALQISASH